MFPSSLKASDSRVIQRLDSIREDVCFIDRFATEHDNCTQLRTIITGLLWSNINCERGYYLVIYLTVGTKSIKKTYANDILYAILFLLICFDHVHYYLKT